MVFANVTSTKQRVDIVRNRALARAGMGAQSESVAHGLTGARALFKGKWPRARG